MTQIKKSQTTGKAKALKQNVKKDDTGASGSGTGFQGFPEIPPKAPILRERQEKLKYRTNDGGPFVLKLTTADAISANNILNSDSFREVEGLKVFVPSFYIFSEGVIANVDQKYQLKDLQENARAESEIVEVERLTRWDAAKKKVEATDKLKITFRGTKLPNSMSIYGINLRVTYFIPMPLFCRKCLSYGHFKKYCTGEEICEGCTEKHVSEEERKDCVKVWCKFCKNDEHKTHDKSCKERKRQQTIKRIMTIRKLTFWEAQKYMLGNQDEAAEIEQQAEKQSALYATVVKLKEQEETIEKLRSMVAEIRQKVCNSDTRGNEDLVQEDKAEGRVTIAIITDISKAFDHVKIETLIEIMEQHEISQEISNWIHQLLINRELIMSTEKEQISIMTSEGVPQGCKLSPTLFNIYTTEIHDLNNEECRVLQYADDVTLVIAEHNKNILETAVVKYPTNPPKNLHIYDNIKGLEKMKKVQTSNVILKTISLETIKKFADHFVIYTDGSDDGENRGIGIIMQDTGEEISKKIEEEISICTVETIAIFLAIKFAISMGKEKIVIFTDSQSAALSLQNKNNTKYYDTLIHKLVDNHPDKQITIQWIPGHTGIIGNEKADAAARRGTTTDAEKIKVTIPKEENIKITEKRIYKKWCQKFKEITNEKGKFYREIVGEVPNKKPWFKGQKKRGKPLRKLQMAALQNAVEKLSLNENTPTAHSEDQISTFPQRRKNKPFPRNLQPTTPTENMAIEEALKNVSTEFVVRKMLHFHQPERFSVQ
uniref:RNase H type-1 domain-containing protein n=1 Tax=Phlebotomus papatasi TaxID=29031 RepID=A0A240SYU6_PHLPP